MALYFAMTGTRDYNILIILQLANVVVLGIQIRKLTQLMDYAHTEPNMVFANKGQTCFDGAMAQPKTSISKGN